MILPCPCSWVTGECDCLPFLPPSTLCFFFFSLSVCQWVCGVSSQALYKENHYVVWPAFSSTTADAKVAQEFFAKRKGEKAVGALFVIVPLPGSQSRGWAISSLSALAKEQARLCTLSSPSLLPPLHPFRPRSSSDVHPFTHGELLGKKGLHW